MRPSMLLAGVAMLVAGAADALPPLEQDEVVRRELFGAGVAYEIFMNCPTMDARWFRVLGRAKKLENRVKSMGYTQADIERTINSKKNQQELARAIEAYLAKKGVRKGDTAAYCRLGAEEIAGNTFSGYLLRAHSAPVSKAIPDLGQ